MGFDPKVINLVCLTVCVKYFPPAHGQDDCDGNDYSAIVLSVLTATQLFGFDVSSPYSSSVTITSSVTPYMGKEKTTFDNSCCNKLGLSCAYLRLH